MLYCSYCGSRLELLNKCSEKHLNKCSFCGATDFVQQEGQRKKQSLKYLVTVEDAIQYYDVLITYSTYDLYLCLKEIRQARSMFYGVLRLSNKMADEFGEDAAAYTTEQGKDYEFYTRKQWVIENILIGRQGYFPERITNEVLEKLKQNMGKSSRKRMEITSQRQYKKL